MLYDPKWNKRDIEYSGVSLRAFIGWLEQQAPDQQYNYCWPQTCAVAQYLQAQGASKARSMVDFPSHPDEEGFWLEEIVNGVDTECTCTFGHALERARSVARRMCIIID